MPRYVISVGVCCVALGALVAAQVSVRDPGLAASGVRRVPIGTATLTGTVVAADTGRPLANARVAVNGQTGSRATIAAAAAQPQGRSGAAGPGALVAFAGFSRQAVSDAQGRFVMQALPQGQFTVDVQRDQYLNASYGQTRFGRPGALLSIDEGQTLSISIRLSKGGVISGTVFDEDGTPLGNARVQAYRFGYQAGVRRLQGTNSVMSDDRGAYRLFGLQPGEYLIGASPNRANLSEMAAREQAAFEAALQAAQANSPAGVRPTSVAIPNPSPAEPVFAGYAQTFAPRTPFVASATRVALGAGDVRAGVDVTVVPSRTGGVDGVVTGVPAGMQVQVWLVNTDPMAASTGVMGLALRPDGTFRAQGLQPGQYLVVAETRRATPPAIAGPSIPELTPSAAADRLWARDEVRIDGQITARVALVLQPPKSVSGTISFDTTRPVDLSRTVMSVVLSPAQSAVPLPQVGGPQQARIDADGRFTVEGVVPGRYVLRVTGVPGFLRSALHNGEDVLDTALVVGEANVSNLALTMAEAGGSVAGVLTDGRGSPVQGYTVVIAPADRRLWLPGSRRILMARTGIDGRYRFGGLPTGAYLLAAVVDFENGAQFDPEFLTALSAASLPVSATEGGTAQHDIRIAP